MALYREFTLKSPGIWPTVLAFIKANAAACAEKGTPIRLIVTSEERRRTKEQNAYYFGVVLRDIAEQAWVNGEQFGAAAWHEHFAEQFAPREELRLPSGRLVTHRKSTKDFTVAEFGEYLTKVQASAGNDFGVTFDGVHG